MAAHSRPSSPRWWRLGAILAVCAAVLADAGKPPHSKDKGATKLAAAQSFRLPGDVIPSNYTLRIVTHFQDDNFRFYGQAFIDIDVVRDTSVVRMHAKQLQVDQRAVTVTLLDADEDSNSIPEQQEEEEEGPQEQSGAQAEDQDQKIKPTELPEQRPEEEKPAEEKQEEKKPEQQKLEEQKPEEQKTEKPEEQKTEEQIKPEEQKLEEQKTEEQKPDKIEEQKLEEQKLEEQKQEEQKPLEEKPVEQKLEALKPEEQKPAPPQKPEEEKREELKPVEDKPDEPKIEKQKQEEQKLEEPKQDELKPEEQKLEEHKSDKQKVEGQIEAEQKPEEQKPEVTKPEEQKPDVQKPLEQIPEGQKLEETKQETKPEMQLEEQKQDVNPGVQSDGEKVDLKPGEQDPTLPQEATKDKITGAEEPKLGGPIVNKEKDEELVQTQPITTESTQDQVRRRRRRQGHYQHRPRDAEFQGLRLSNVSMDSKLQQLVITLSEPLRAGRRYRIAVRYWGTLNTEDRGYFRGAYLVEGRARYVSSTVFEPAEARRAFPCFDEPHMKANFSLVLGRHKNYTSSANMPLDRTESMEEKPDWYWDYYPTTPKMSTYLVAFMVHALEGTSLNPGAPGIQFRAWTVPGRSHQANFSLSVAPKIMSTLGAQLGAPGVLPKHDMVAVPGFKSEALENWGLVSFEEHHLLLPANAGQLNKQSVSTVVAHELAHIWFGNLITPAWWSDIWLSEGFATFYSAEALQAVFPAWRFHETAAGNAYLLVTHTDAMPSTTPVIHAADNPNKLESVFGAISYYKGYWLLRMLESSLGADVFDNGVRRYVRRHLHSSVRTKDLWVALQEAVDERQDLDLEAAASASASTGEAVVVGDDSDEEDVARVVVPDTKPTSATNATRAVVVPARSKRDASLVMKAPITQLVIGAIDQADKGSGEASELTDASASTEALEQVKLASPTKNRVTPANVKKSPELSEEVLSPPRRGPGATGFHGKVGWLPHPVDQIMKNWVTQPGHPIVSVYRNLETGVVTLNQRRYLSPAPAGGFPCNASTAWWIPVRWATIPRGSGATGTADVSKLVFWMPPTCSNVTLPVKVPREELLILNAGLSGLYRVRYESSALQQLARLSRAGWRQVAPLTRLQLVADALDLARAGRAPYQHVLRMVDHLGRDNNPMVWRAALPHLMMLHRQLRARRDGVVLRSWLQDLVSPHANGVGFTTRPQDTPLQASLRYKVTTLACLADHSTCQRKAKKSLKQFMAGDTDAIPVGRLTSTQLCAAVRWGSPAEWRFLRAQLSAPASVLPRKAVASALGCSRDQETLRSLLADTVDANSTLRRSDVSAVLSAVAANEVGSDIVLRFFEEKAPQVYKRLGGHPRVEKSFREIAESLNTKRQLDRLDAVLRQFQSQTPTRSPPSWGRDMVRENIRWAERSRGEISRWLRARADSDDELELRRTQSKTKTKTKATPASTTPNANSKAPRRLEEDEDVDTENTSSHGIFNHLLNTIFLNSQI
ncbi:uncharacterized protein LOC113205348 [Frankliniella occidentalis]|uniref:Uncharacterized protein LOC113205348 n=1 Tax=Frankliniella occidentalis TaxID=133901 RepID=A0A6J1S688_FRAOC|nr:uncharacterized protein LOC113205348 [Frankliniella occidentalis]